MSQKYKIDRWDPVLLSGKEVYPKPLIYLKADDTLLKFAEENSNALVVKITDTGSIYDGKFMQGVFYNSSTIPNCRPNFFDETNLYAIYLISEWHSYPPSNGSCEIYGLKGGKDSPSTQPNDARVNLTTIPKPVASVASVTPSSYKKSNLTLPITILIISVTLLVLLTLCLINRI
jgi:hypothetical protein